MSKHIYRLLLRKQIVPHLFPNPIDWLNWVILGTEVGPQ